MALVKYNNNSISAVTAAASIPNGALTHIKTLTASSSATLSFVHGTDGVVLDSTYPIYKFEFINIHAATDDQQLNFNMSIDSGSNYNVTKTTTFFRTFHNEADATVLEYRASNDLAQNTGFQNLTTGSFNADDSSINGELQIFSPSSTTFVKHFISTIIDYANGSSAMNMFIAGYGNTTSAVDAIQFKMSSGNIDVGTIKMYGIK
jgi:hypothetical protein